MHVGYKDCSGACRNWLHVETSSMRSLSHSRAITKTHKSFSVDLIFFFIAFFLFFFAFSHIRKTKTKNPKFIQKVADPKLKIKSKCDWLVFSIRNDNYKDGTKMRQMNQQRLPVEKRMKTMMSKYFAN